MQITCDPLKRRTTLAERGLDFADAAAVFTGPVFEFEDRRVDYGERRIITIGLLESRPPAASCGRPFGIGCGVS